MVQFYQVNNLTGGINSRAEENTLAFTGNSPAEARDIENFVPLFRGGQQKTKGFEHYRSLGNTPVKALYRFTKANGISQLLACCGGKIFQFSDNQSIDLEINVDPNALVHFETVLDKCLISDGINTLRSFDGTNISLLTSANPNVLLGAKQTLFYQNRLWVFGNAQNSSLLYYSLPNDINTGYDSQFINCDNNDGQKITGIAKFFIPGMLEPVIIVCKDRSIGIITGDGSSNNPYIFSKINQDFGILNHQHLISYSQSVIFYTRQGIYSCQSDLQNLNLHFQKLSEPIQNLLNNLPVTKSMNTIAFRDWQRDRLSFAVTELSHNNNNLIYHYDTRLNCWYKERWNNSLDCTSSWVDIDGTWFHGDSKGKVYKHTQVDSFAGFPITAVFQTPYLDFSRPNELKQLLEVQLMLRGNGNYSLSANIMFDFGTRTGKTTTLSLNASQYKWNDGIWTNNNTVYQWGTTAIKLKRFYPASFFRQVQFTFIQTGLNQPIDLFGLNFLVT